MTPDPVAMRVLSETGDVNKAITRLTAGLMWTTSEAKSAIRACLRSKGAPSEEAKRRSVPSAG